MAVGTGSGAMICMHCGKPMVTSVIVGGMHYHYECTLPAGFSPPRYGPLPRRLTAAEPIVPIPARWPTRDDLDRMLRDEVARFCAGQTRAEDEFARILADKVWDLYAR